VTWIARRDQEGGIGYLVPIGDIQEHQPENPDCKCEPSVQRWANGYMAIEHRAFDGREHREPDHDRLNCAECYLRDHGAEPDEL
jgi:hypothetical protein